MYTITTILTVQHTLPCRLPQAQSRIRTCRAAIHRPDLRVSPSQVQTFPGEASSSRTANFNLVSHIRFLCYSDESSPKLTSVLSSSDSNCEQLKDDSSKTSTEEANTQNLMENVKGIPLFLDSEDDDVSYCLKLKLQW